jgi:hypothetical protein
MWSDMVDDIKPNSERYTPSCSIVEIDGTVFRDIFGAIFSFSALDAGSAAAVAVTPPVAMGSAARILPSDLAGEADSLSALGAEDDIGASDAPLSVTSVFASSEGDGTALAFAATASAPSATAPDEPSGEFKWWLTGVFVGGFVLVVGFALLVFFLVRKVRDDQGSGTRSFDFTFTAGIQTVEPSVDGGDTEATEATWEPVVDDDY